MDWGVFLSAAIALDIAPGADLVHRLGEELMVPCIPVAMAGSRRAHTRSTGEQSDRCRRHNRFTEDGTGDDARYRRRDEARRREHRDHGAVSPDPMTHASQPDANSNSRHTAPTMPWRMVPPVSASSASCSGAAASASLRTSQ